MMISAWFVVAWFFLRGASAMRPSALQRLYTLLWMFFGSFALLIIVTIYVQSDKIAGGYFIMFYFASIFFALLIAFIELFFLPTKSAYVAHLDSAGSTHQNSEPASRPLTGTTGGQSEDRPILDDDATETTSLLRGDRRSFARYGSRRHSVETGTDHSRNNERSHESTLPAELGKPYEGEQDWSGKLPGWLWVIQFLVLVPINIILVGQIALLLTSALYQTPADGSSPLLIYICFAGLTALLLAPTGPFIHRFTYHIPTFLFLVCVGTVIYNLVAFPFSRDHRLKVYFLQHIECDTGKNTVSLTGLSGYVEDIIATIPSAQGQNISCDKPTMASRKELKTCSWPGLPANVVPAPAATAPYSNKTELAHWVGLSISRPTNNSEATITIRGQNTRACRIFFDMPILELEVEGGVSDPRFNATGEQGSTEVRLWHREWEKAWNVSVNWDYNEDTGGGPHLSGKVVCLWSDANTAGTIPAWDEVLHYMPVWSIASKFSDGLVEGSKRFSI